MRRLDPVNLDAIIGGIATSMIAYVCLVPFHYGENEKALIYASFLWMKMRLCLPLPRRRTSRYQPVSGSSGKLSSAM